MEKPDERIKELMKVLADTISQVFSVNEEIKQALSKIENEGYHIDLLLASVTRVSKKGDNGLSDNIISDFDRSFLEKIHLRFGEED